MTSNIQGMVCEYVFIDHVTFMLYALIYWRHRLCYLYSKKCPQIIGRVPTVQKKACHTLNL